MSFPFEEVYHIYLSHLEDVNYKYRYLGHEDKYGMSRAGQCYLKHYYFRHKYERFPLDELRKQRVPRLGQLLHSDMESAIKFFVEHHDEYKSLPDRYKPENCTIFIEKMVSFGDKRGHVDIFMVFKYDDFIEVYDLKSIAAWGWRVKFGDTNVPDTNEFAQLQIATYTESIMLDLGINKSKMFLVYYDKDQSKMKTVQVDSLYFGKAKNYWDDLKAFMRAAKDDNFINNVMPYEFIMVPVEKWECSWCSYQPHCNQIINMVKFL